MCEAEIISFQIPQFLLWFLSRQPIMSARGDRLGPSLPRIPAFSYLVVKYAFFKNLFYLAQMSDCGLAEDPEYFNLEIPYMPWRSFSATLRLTVIFVVALSRPFTFSRHYVLVVAKISFIINRLENSRLSRISKHFCKKYICIETHWKRSKANCHFITINLTLIFLKSE